MYKEMNYEGVEALWSELRGHEPLITRKRVVSMEYIPTSFAYCIELVIKIDREINRSTTDKKSLDWLICQLQRERYAVITTFDGYTSIALHIKDRWVSWSEAYDDLMKIFGDAMQL